MIITMSRLKNIIREEIHKILRESNIDNPTKYEGKSQMSSNDSYMGDSNQLNLPYIDTWHEGQHAALRGDTEQAIKIMTRAAKEADDLGSKNEALYYIGTIAWLNGDFEKVKRLSNNKLVKIMGADVTLNRLLRNNGKSYSEAYLDED